MAGKASNLLTKAARELWALLGAPPFTRPEPAPAVVLVTLQARTARERAMGYRRRYSRYLAAVGGDQHY